MFDSDTVLLTDNEILITAAKRNYERFAVSVSNVDSVKLTRYYTTEQQSDLDIKTGTNKIGEIVNLSQILTSLYWDNIYHGQSHEENFELYCDICTLNIMSGIEIDSAKKEFQIDNPAELRRIRKKYRQILTDKNGKRIKPFFFNHLLKTSGKKEYINTKTTVFKEFETPMDYLQEETQKRYRPENRLKPFQPFSVLLDRDGFKEDNVYKPSITKTFAVVKKHLKNLRMISATDDKLEENKIRLRHQCSIDMFTDLDKIKYSYSTMYKILSFTDKEQYKDFGTTLAFTLFRIRHTDFYNALLVSEEPISELVEDAEGDIKFYERRYKKKDSEC